MWLTTRSRITPTITLIETMKTEINPQDSNRQEAFNLWMSSPVPMVTLVKTMEATKLLRYSKKHGMSFNMLLCWCIGKAASQVEEFYVLPERGKLYKYDSLAVNVIVNNKEGGINSCDIPYTHDLNRFNHDYMTLTQSVNKNCESSFQEESMVIGTSAMIETELDCIVNQYAKEFNNPMVMWGKYRKGWFKTTLPISFQFHHVQMDGAHAGRFLANLQNVIDKL